MSNQALSDLRVVEWGEGVCAPFCTKLMADLGAEVIKVESPVPGDELRSYGPFPNDIPDPESSGLFLYLNTNKLGITLDPLLPTGREILLKLLGQADLFVESQPPRLMEQAGLDFRALREVNPNLIVTSITPFGQTGPYRDWKGYDLTCAALGGISSAIGYPDREPLTPPLFQTGYQGGLQGAIASMIALFQRDLTGRGAHVDLSQVESWATFHVGVGAQTFLSDERVRKRSGHRALHRPFPDEVLPCKDGYVCVDAPQNRQWRRLLEVMGNPAWASDPIFHDRVETAERYGEKADGYLTEWLMQHTKEEVFRLCQESRVPAAPVRTVAEIMEDAQLEARGHFAEVDHGGRRLRYPGACYQMSETPAAINRPAPRLGEHNEEILCRRLGYPAGDLADLRRAGVI